MTCKDAVIRCNIENEPCYKTKCMRPVTANSRCKYHNLTDLTDDPFREVGPDINLDQLQEHRYNRFTDYVLLQMNQLTYSTNEFKNAVVGFKNVLTQEQIKIEAEIEKLKIQLAQLSEELKNLKNKRKNKRHEELETEIETVKQNLQTKQVEREQIIEKLKACKDAQHATGDIIDDRYQAITNALEILSK